MDSLRYQRGTQPCTETLLSGPVPHSELRFYGSFLISLPEMVTPIKGHSLSLRRFSPTLSAPTERSEY